MARGRHDRVDEEENMMPKTLLVPLDGSLDAERALPVAQALAARFGADIVLVDAQLNVEVPSDAIEAAKASVHAQGARVEIVRSVSVRAALRAVADDANEPIVCMATHARAGLGHALFGSVAEDVVRGLEIPAVLVGPTCSPTVRLEGPLLVCIDGSAKSNAIVPIAREWALALGARVVLVHVFHPLDVATATRPEMVVAAAVEQFGSDVDVETRVVRGYSPVITIGALIDDLEPALVALATHGRTGLARAALGSVATAVVRHSACPALVVRPALGGSGDATLDV
jgi:nucleotide-binding universal stress UspA family protein